MLSHSRAVIAAALVISFSAPVSLSSLCATISLTSNILMLLRKQ
jgi:hypothetical protein